MVNWREIDAKWQQAWRDAKLFEATPSERPKFYITVAYPYVSGPMHIGHGRTYTVPDVISRYKRMRGYSVLFPMAYHFTGTPIVGAAKRVERKEKQFVEVLIKRYGIPEGELKKLEDPHYFATYWAKMSDLSYRKGMEWLGYSIDWRREFTTVDPQYSKFVTWQYHKLMDAGLIVKGEHPVKWCPRCQNPVTDHDLLDGEGVGIVEFTLLKYRFGDYVLPAATLRPETVFGVTNLWLNPNVEYVLADVDGEKWIVSREAVDKLREHGREIGGVQKFSTRELMGKEIEVPLTRKKVFILPANFVNPDNASGVVGSVPAHAPYDYIALRELQQRPEQLKKWGIDPAVVQKLEAVSLIEVKGFTEFPAIDVVQRMKIKNQNDQKLEEATAEVYRNEFAKGVMRDWVPKYGGMPVSEAKVQVRDDLVMGGEAVVMYEFSAKPVTCRCGAKCCVKLVKDQWFLNYADDAWKDKARACLAQMNLVPPKTRAQFEHIINWLHEWPCTRQRSMGTPAPWDQSWIIESLSDSTIYMAYYTISHILKTIEPDKLSDEFFDYAFLGKGDVAAIAKATGIDEQTLQRMQREFEYWYPLNYRTSANELIPNHLTFFVFHHSMIFPQKLWPKGIVSFGIAVLEGQKMSSSKGNIVAINEAVKKYGADAVRLYLMSTVEPWQDFDWRANEADAMLRHLERFYSQAQEIIATPTPERPSLTLPDRWMMSKLQEHVRVATESLDRFETRKALQHSFFLLMQDLKWYLKRVEREEACAYVLKRVLDIWVRLLAPFTPHVCEELWHQMGKKGFVSLAEWPKVEEGLRDKRVELAEDYLASVVEDISNILRVVKKKAAKICLYVAQDWKWRAYKMALEMVLAGKVDLKVLLRDVEKKLGLRLHTADLVKFLQEAVQEFRAMSEEQLVELKAVELDEYGVLYEAAGFLGKQFGTQVNIFKADDPARYDPQNRALLSKPMRPAIYVE